MLMRTVCMNSTWAFSVLFLPAISSLFASLLPPPAPPVFPLPLPSLPCAPPSSSCLAGSSLPHSRALLRLRNVTHSYFLQRCLFTCRLLPYIKGQSIVSLKREKERETGRERRREREKESPQLIIMKFFFFFPLAAYHGSDDDNSSRPGWRK